MNTKRKKLLIELEGIMSNGYNDFIENYGPGGVYEGSGRSFSYPATFRDEDGELHKRMMVLPKFTSEQVLMSGFYQLGANQMPVYWNLNMVLQHLEKRYGLVLDMDEE